MPNADKAFAFVSSDYGNLTLPNGQTEIPMIMSDKDSETRIVVSVPNGNGTYRVGIFNMAGGVTKDLSVNTVSAPVLQIGFIYQSIQI